jgi:hypothetical protein
MNRIYLLLIYSLSLSFSQAQITAAVTVKTNEDLSRSVGSQHPITVTVKNNASYSYVVGKSVYAVVVEYEGSTREGQVFNTSSELKTTLPAGQSKTFEFKIQTPNDAGVYAVRISFKWGNKVISNIITKQFEIEGNYEVGISARRTAFTSSGRGDVEIVVKNTGDINWPEGDYSIRFGLVKAQSGSSRTDQRCFELEPRVVETWEGFAPSRQDNILLKNFILPQTRGDYRVKVYLLKDGNQFLASGNPKEITFRIE